MTFDLLPHPCRVGEREAALEAALRLLQKFYLDLEKFLNWLAEAETTANVLQDATHKAGVQEDPSAGRQLLRQWQVGWGGSNDPTYVYGL